MTDLLPANVDREAILRALNINVRDPKHQAALLIAQRYDLDPVLRHVVIISGNPYVTRDGLLHVAHQTQMLDGIVVDEECETDTEWTAKVTVYVKGQSHGYTYRGRYPKSGQQKRYGPEMAVKCAEVMALRRAFGVTGIPTVEEQSDKADVVEAQVRENNKVAGELASGQSVPESASPVSPAGGAAAAVAVPSSSAGGEEAQAEEVPPTGSQSPDGEPSPLPDGEGEGGVESLAHGDSPAPTATMLLAATGKSAGAAVMAVKRAAEAISAEGPYMAEEIAADPVFAAKVLAHLGGMPADGTTPTATYTKRQNGWIHAVWANHGGDNARKAFLSQLTSGRTDSSSELTAAEKKAYLDKTEELA